jgi:hypothetical protein
MHTTTIQVIALSLTSLALLTALIRALLLLLAGLAAIYGKTVARRRAARDLVQALAATTPRSVVSISLKPRKSTDFGKTPKA